MPHIAADIHEKEGTKMSETKTSQVREAAQGAWQKMLADSIARMELASAEVARMQETALSQNRQAIDEMAKLSRDSVDYFGQLSTEWRKLTLEATRKAAELFTFQG
jgi:hypothetical protein